jgi:eukaryotic-like serine/threonine-protein kinase
MPRHDEPRSDAKPAQAAGRGVPERIGKYTIEGVIGRGAVGIVYKGHDTQIDRPVAIKTLRPEIFEDLSENQEALRRFASEVRSAGRCLHPNIVTIFDYIEHDAAPHIVMEYVNAGTLENVIRGGALLPVQQIGEIMTQLLFALGHAHSKGIIHRDVKPANILCPSATTIKVTDFGVAHIEALNLTKSGGLGSVGTPNYMAPERFLGRQADNRSDLFSAGVILFQLLSGSKPFLASSIPELMRKVMQDSAPDVQTLRPELGAAFDSVVQRSLARNPDDRYPTAEAFIAALQLAVNASGHEHKAQLDLTKLALPPALGGESGSTEQLNRTMADRLAASAIDELSRSLARSLGPMARVILRQALLESTDIDALLSSLTRQIKTDAEAKDFRRMAERTLREHHGIAELRMATTIQPDEIRSATEALLPLIGPLARLLVAKQAQTAIGRDDFYRRLAEEIPNEQDRRTFLTLRASLENKAAH